jgi:peptide deformylase
MEEGCLSVPGVQKTVARPNRIEIINHDISGHRYRLKAQGLLSRVCQHEIDHLNGILIIDHPSIETKSNDKHII